MSLAASDPGSALLRLPNSFRAFYGAFDRLHPLQLAAIDPILEGRDLVLQAATGSGKTEAVLAPCLERVLRSAGQDALAYIVPTRALAIDLERRLEPILTRLELRLAVRTGDLKRQRGQPALLVTTPESLDVALGSANSELRGFLGRIRTVVIDEAHALVHGYRGQQLAWLLRRLERRSGGPAFCRPLQRIAISATISDAHALKVFLGFRPDAAHLLEARDSGSPQREIVPHLVQLKDEPRELPALLEDLYDAYGYRKLLLFANSRARCDQLYAGLSQQGPFAGVTELHYSNLKPKERWAVERRFRRHARALCIATSTLELGIDIGDVDGVVLFEPPEAVSAFVQRIGRANRRSRATHFWGLCRGEQAGAQLLRFLGLLHLARQGATEDAPARRFPSVLVQQIVSCLYEKKLLSRASLEALFPEELGVLEPVFDALIRQDWLREARTAGLYRGGRRFWDSLLQRRIWSNFPEAEETYALEIDGVAVADLPHSVVRQLEVGERVLLAGKRIQVLEIDTHASRRVLARPVDQLDDKTLFWLGAGFRVPLEVARSIREILTTRREGEERSWGLFTRTRRLLEAERMQAARTVTLANGIEVGRSQSGLYRYRTWLGSVGNLMLRWTIEHDLGLHLPELQVTSDEVGLESTHWIDFRLLRLPTQRDEVQRWVAQHLEALLPLFPLNAFAALLPAHLLVEELTAFLFDPRVAEAFARYLAAESTVVSGDSAMLAVDAQEPASVNPVAFSVPGEPLLDREKRRWQIREGPAPFVVSPTACHQPRAITGTLIGDYTRHEQCARFLSHSFLPLEARPPLAMRSLTALGVQRTEAGLRHEARVLQALEAQPGLIRVAACDEAGRPRSLEARFAETLQCLEGLIRQVEATPGHGRYVAQAVLLSPAVLEPGGSYALAGPDQPDPLPHPGVEGESAVVLRRLGGITPAALLRLARISGTGIPDLVRVFLGPDGAVLEVGDIKDSRAPRESQKWQVAWYAWLMRKLVEEGRLPAGTTVSSRGFLMLRPRGQATGLASAGTGLEPQGLGLEPQGLDLEPQGLGLEPQGLDLEPYLMALPTLLRNLAGVLAGSPGEAGWQMKGHCVTCPWLESCYREVLHLEDIQLVPGLGAGTLEKLRCLGLKTVEAVGGWLEQPAAEEACRPGAQATSARGGVQWEGGVRADPVLRGEGGERLEGQLLALRTHQVMLRERETRLFPANLSRAILVHGMDDPLSGVPRALGWRVLDARGRLQGARSWLMPDEETFPDWWAAITRELLEVWGESIAGGRGPQLITFGGRAWRMLQGWDGGALSFLDEPGRRHRTDLRRLLMDHFHLPVLGRVSLASIGRVLGLEPVLPELETLWHPDQGPELSAEAWAGDAAKREEARAWLDGALDLMAAVWRWAVPHLESGWTQAAFDMVVPEAGPEQAYARFLAEERRLREEDVRRLQRHPLAGRVARLRAIGPLTCSGTRLDEEGGFLYTFQAPPEAATSRFREGDFLKLAPVGAVDLQGGYPVILVEFARAAGQLGVRARLGRLPIQRGWAYSLEEDLTDWNGPRLDHAVRTVFSTDRSHPLAGLLEGRWPLERDPEEVLPVRRWLETVGRGAGLNDRQRQALELPFRRRLSLIEGPPGTGKSHLLAWTLIALVYRAREAEVPMRIVVSALTHQAIDQVLRKVEGIVARHGLADFPARCFKLGRPERGPEGVSPQGPGGPVRVEALEELGQLEASRYAIVGATGFGLYAFFEGHKGVFPRVFDRVVFDEASQVLVPQALLTLLYGKGEILCYGDVKQLPPVVLSRPEGEAGASARAHRSILEQLLGRYGPTARIRLDVTYRMNDDICAFPSRIWYDGELRAAPGVAEARLERLAWQGAGDLMDRVLDPLRPVSLLLLDPGGWPDPADLEAAVVAELAYRLMKGQGLEAGRLGLISPHRAQNNQTAALLSRRLEGGALPLIDTVERVQGAERDVILYALSSFDPDRFESHFLNNPNRFNVALTRARQKLVVVGSRAFFSWIPRDEAGLRANACFKAFLEHCRLGESVILAGGDRL